MPLRWEWRRQHSGRPGIVPQDLNLTASAPSVTPQLPIPVPVPTNVPDVVLLSNRHWAINAEREALNDAVTLVDSLLHLSSLDTSAPTAQRNRWLNNVDVILNQQRQQARMRADDPQAVGSIPDRTSAESLFLRASWDDLCRRRSMAHADSEATLVGSGRLRRHSTVCGRAQQNRWRQRDANQTEGQPTTTGTDRLGPTEVFKRLPRPISRTSAFDEQLIRAGSRQSARVRLCREILDHAGAAAEKLSQSVSWQDIADNTITVPIAAPEESTSLRDIPQEPVRKESSNINIAENSAESVVISESTAIVLEGNVDNTLAVEPTVEDIQDIIRTQLECPVCLDYLTPPIKQCANGHCVCSACYPRLSHCATCRANFIGTSNVVLENLVRTLCFPCRYKDAGCTEVLKMEQRPSHEETCPFRPRRCPTACCDWQGLPGQLRGHITSNHQHYVMELNELKEFSFCVDRSDGVPTIVHDEQFVIFLDSEMFVFESHYDLWRSKFFAELRNVSPDVKTTMIGSSKNYAYDVELYTRSRNTHLKLRNVVDDGSRQSPTAIKIDLDVFNHFVLNGVYTLYLRMVSIEKDD